MRIRIEALDTLFFRDGKPFTMGSDTWANGIFPPPPSVIYGALRSLYFANHRHLISKANEADDPTKNLVITDIAIEIDGEFFYPLPLDCVKEKGSNDKYVQVFALEENIYPSSSSVPMVLKVNNDKEIENINGGVFNRLSLLDYLNADNGYYYTDLFNYLIMEPKIGIARNKHTHTVNDGMLYRVGLNRLSSKMSINNKPSSISLVVEFVGLELPSQGFLKLGGEGKVASYREIDKEDDIVTNGLQNNLFKIYLSTPAIFKNGWLPEWINPDTFTGNYQGIDLRFLTAAIGKYLNFGGFDIKNKKPKPMYRAVPAGSVFYFEVKNKDSVSQVIQAFNGKSISEINKESGFGLSYVGGV